MLKRSIMSDEERWIEIAKESNCKAILIVWDSELKDEYPIYVNQNEDLDNIVKTIRLSVSMRKILEIILI